jgi:hypothetical protein
LTFGRREILLRDKVTEWREQMNIRIADKDDLSWLIEHDHHVSEETLIEKIGNQEVLILRQDKNIAEGN